MAQQQKPQAKPVPPPATKEIAVAQQSPIMEIVKAKQREIQVMLPNNIDKARFMRTVVEIASTPKLMECSRASLEKAILDLAFVGLSLGPLGHAFFIPFKKQCQLQFGYRGLVALARRSGEVSTVEADVVHEGDEFDYKKGTRSFLDHVRSLDPKREERPITFAWAMFKMKDGSEQWDLMSRAQIETIRDRSEGYQYVKSINGKSPWDTDRDEMFKKTVLKRVCKLLNLSPELAKAVEVDNESENIDFAPQPAKAVPAVEPPLMRKQEKGYAAQDAVVETAAATNGTFVEEQAPDFREKTLFLGDPEGDGYGPND